MRFDTSDAKTADPKKPTRRLEKVAGSLESTFYKKLMADAKDGDCEYDSLSHGFTRQTCSLDETFFSFAKSLAPAALDLEIRSIVTLEGHATFINALTRRLISHRDFEAVQAMQNVFLNIHGEVMMHNEELQEHLERLLAVQKKESQRVLDLITSSLGTLGFVRGTM